MIDDDFDPDETNPATSVSPPNAGDSDKTVLEFYDTDDPENTKGDPVVERRYELDESQREEFAARLDTHLDMDMIVPAETMMMFADREDLYDILDTVTEGED